MMPLDRESFKTNSKPSNIILNSVTTWYRLKKNAEFRIAFNMALIFGFAIQGF